MKIKGGGEVIGGGKFFEGWTVAGFDELILRGFMNGRHFSGGGLLLKAIGNAVL
jgi:hypothetical protein